MISPIQICDYHIGEEYPVFIVAEISGNHDGKLENAINLVRAAKRAGANAIKLQTYTADTITLRSNRTDFQIPPNSTWSNFKTLWDLYNKAHTPWEWHKKIYEAANQEGLLFFSSSFCHQAVELNEKLGVCAHKVASPEIFDIPLLREVGSTGKPIIISTGLAKLEDIELAVSTLKDTGNNKIILLKCTTAYPADLNDLNLKTIPALKKNFNLNVGFSDHSLGVLASTLSVAMGAVVIEKHIKMSAEDTSVDAEFSSSEEEFKRMVQLIKDAKKATGTITFELPESASKNIMGKRSLYVTKPIKSGEKFNKHNIKSIRPGFGLHPKYYFEIIGCKATMDLDRGDALTWDKIEKK